MFRLLRNIVIVIALVVGVAFGFFNFESVTVNLLFGEVEVPLAVVLIVDFALGFGVALLLLFSRLILLRRKLSRTRRQLADVQTEVRNLRSMPIHDA